MDTNTKYVRLGDLQKKIELYAKNLYVTKGLFEISVPSLLKDMEWNHMDQMHRPYIHNTYDESLRIALGKDFALSMTKWGNWPFFIPVTDVRLKPGLYYQVMVIAGLIYLHNIISMEEKDENVHLKVEWLITSHKWLKFLHKPLNNKLYRLNVRLQQEDAVIRTQRYKLRKCGYSFGSDLSNYLSANMLTNNTIYPDLGGKSLIKLSDIYEDKLSVHVVGGIEFLSKKNGSEILIWPGVCPHEGAELIKGSLTDNCKIKCAWHGLKFSPARLTKENPDTVSYGFNYKIDGDYINITKS